MRTAESPHIALVLNGEFHHPQRLEQVIDAADLLIAADGGANWLLSAGYQPDVVVGDMDSISPEALSALEASGARMLRHPRHKDETDAELALFEAVALGAARIGVLGGLGGRIDHALANLQLLALENLAGREVYLFDGVSFVWLVRELMEVRGAAGDIVSLLPFASNVQGITTENLEYPLCDESLPLGPARGISNVMLGPSARVTVRSGPLLLVHTPREHLEDQ